jgi:hypothetical protein
MPATSAPVVTGIIAAGLVARGEGVECQNSTESACMGNMDDTASTRESTLEEATAVAGTPRPVEITAGVKTARRRTGEPGITDARMTGPRHIVIPDFSASFTPDRKSRLRSVPLRTSRANHRSPCTSQTVLQVLRRRQRDLVGAKDMHCNAGRPWTADDDDRA